MSLVAAVEPDEISSEVAGAKTVSARWSGTSCLLTGATVEYLAAAIEVGLVLEILVGLVCW